MTRFRHQLEIDLDGDMPPAEPQVVEELGHRGGVGDLPGLIVDDDFHARSYLFPGAMIAVRAWKTSISTIGCPRIRRPALMLGWSQAKL